MKKLFLLSVLLFVAAIVSAQGTYEIITDSAGGKTFMVGQCKKIDFENELCSSWFFEEYNNYNPDPAIIALLKEQVPVPGLIFLGTWCSDSQREVPRFFKIVELAGWCPDNYDIYCLDRKKSVPGVDVAAYNIEFVPTFIFFDGESELGRIIETPTTTIEGDVLKIISH